MLSDKYDYTGVISLHVANDLYKLHNVATVVTDGTYIQFDKEKAPSATTEQGR